MVSIKAPRFDNILFLQGLSERVRHFKLKCVACFCSNRVFATLVTSSSSASRPSPLGLGGCLCIASTAHTFIYRLIYSRTRAYQGIPDPASCRAGLRRGGSVPEPTSPCTPLPQGSRLGDFAQPGKSARLKGSPASLTGKTFDDQDLGWHIATAALPCPCCPDRTCSTAERRSTRLVPRPVADARASLTPRGHGASSHDFSCRGQQLSREVKLTITQACTTTKQPSWEGYPATKDGRCPVLSLFMF